MINIHFNNQQIITILIIFTLSSTILTSCSDHYHHSDDSDVVALNLKGNVTKVEIITQTTIPISEWLYSDLYITSDNYSIIKCRDNAIYSFVGNSVLDFNDYGNLTQITIYNNRGGLIYQDKPKMTRKPTLYNTININVNELRHKTIHDSESYIYDSVGRIVEQITNYKDNIFLHRYIDYNSNGDIEKVICNYESRNISTPNLGVIYQPTDTTFFMYNKFDSIGNWIEMTMIKKGLGLSDSYSMNVRRQITYFEDTIKSPLIDELKVWDGELRTTPAVTFTLVPCDSLSFNISNNDSKRIHCNIPDSAKFDIRLFNLTGGSSVSFSLSMEKYSFFIANISTNPIECSLNDLREYMNQYYITQNYFQNGICILKHEYFDKEISHTNQNLFIYTNTMYPTDGYLTCGNPISCKICYIQPILNGDTTEINKFYTLSIGYDSNSEYKYCKTIDDIINSISIY